jgi:hypothetical protein
MSEIDDEEHPDPGELRAIRSILGLLALVGGLTGYLALLGGLVLAARFAHAGLPITATLSLVPPQQLVSTAAAELLSWIVLTAVAAPGVAFALLYVADGATRAVASRRGHTPRRPRTALPPRGAAKAELKRTLNRRLAVYTAIIVLATTLGLPLDPLGISVIVTVVLMSAVMIAVTNRWFSRRGFVGGMAACVFVGSIGPVLGRQFADPLNMETVTVVRPGRSGLTGRLIAVREESVALERCGDLRVVPLQGGLKINDKPSASTTGRSVAQRLGIPQLPKGVWILERKQPAPASALPPAEAGCDGARRKVRPRPRP